eukprot:6521421-Pyramimonas_sp.AAC.1
MFSAATARSASTRRWRSPSSAALAALAAAAVSAVRTRASAVDTRSCARATPRRSCVAQSVEARALGDSASFEPEHVVGQMLGLLQLIICVVCTE